jgi:hypothetical protein
VAGRGGARRREPPATGRSSGEEQRGERGGREERLQCPVHRNAEEDGFPCSSWAVEPNEQTFPGRIVN